MLSMHSRMYSCLLYTGIHTETARDDWLCDICKVFGWLKIIYGMIGLFFSGLLQEEFSDTIRQEFFWPVICRDTAGAGRQEEAVYERLWMWSR